MKAVINMHYKGTFYVILKLKFFICVNQALFDIFHRLSINFGEKYYNWTIEILYQRIYIWTQFQVILSNLDHISALHWQNESTFSYVDKS